MDIHGPSFLQMMRAMNVIRGPEKSGPQSLGERAGLSIQALESRAHPTKCLFTLKHIRYRLIDFVFKPIYRSFASLNMSMPFKPIPRPNKKGERERKRKGKKMRAIHATCQHIYALRYFFFLHQIFV